MVGAYRGKVAVVTGGASGIGLEVSRALARAGATVIVADIDEIAARAAVVTLAPSTGAAHRAAGLDVRDGDAVEAFFDAALAREGRLDLVFNNAGVAVAGEFHRLDRDQVARVIDVNLRGCVHVAHAAFRRMVAQGSGHLVNTASGFGLVPGGANAPYITSKFGVVGLSESLRIEGHDHGVRVSAVCPGFVQTPMLDNLEMVGVDSRRALEALPVPKVQPAEAARIILDGVARNRALITFPRYVGWLVLIYRLFPRLAFHLGLRGLRRSRALTD